MFRLGAEGFRKFDLWYQNVAAPMVELRPPRAIEIHVLPQDGAAIDSFVVDNDFVFRDVVVNHHLARADNDHLAHLLRIQPANMNVCDDLSRIFKTKKDNVIDPFLHVGHALTADGNRLRVAKPILNDADIVGREVPEGVDVGTDAPEVQALTVDVAKFAELTGINQSLRITDGRVVNESMARHHNEISFGSASREFIDLGNFRRERLLYENVFAGVEDLIREGEVTCGGCRNYHAIHTGIVESSLMRL